MATLKATTTPYKILRYQLLWSDYGRNVKSISMWIKIIFLTASYNGVSEIVVFPFSTVCVRMQMSVIIFESGRFALNI